MSSNTRPSVMDAARAVDRENDEATRIKVCRGIVREAAKHFMKIGAGTLVEGIAEVELVDRLDRCLLDYLKAKREPETAAIYLGLSARLVDSLNTSVGAVAATSPAAPEPAGGSSES